MNKLCPFCKSKFITFDFYAKCPSCSNDDVIVCKYSVNEPEIQIVFAKYCENNDYSFAESFIKFKNLKEFTFVTNEYSHTFTCENATIAKLLNKIETIILLK